VLSRRRAERLTKAGSLHETVEEVGELSRRRAERLTKAGSLHDTVPARRLQSAIQDVRKKGVKLKCTGKENKLVGHMRTESKKEGSDVQSRRCINKWTQGNCGVWQKMATARKRMTSHNCVKWR
jgi:hypothetical protein